MTDSEIQNYVDQLHNAIKGLGTDEATLIKVTVEHPLKIRLKIKEQYKKSYGEDLFDVFKSEISGDFLNLMLALYTDIYEFDAEQCYKAIEGLGTNDDALIEIIGTRPGWMLKKIKEEYKKKYKKELEDVVIGDTSGHYQKLLVTLLQCNRSENKNPDIEECKKIADELYDAGEKKLGTDEQKFNKYIGNCSSAELMTIAREYHRLHGNSFIKAIESEFSGDIAKLITTVIYANISPSEYFATRIRESVKGMGTNEKILNRVIVSRNEIDMKLIKEYYRLLYQRDMLQDIKDDTSGNYKNLLVALIDK